MANDKPAWLERLAELTAKYDLDNEQTLLNKLDQAGSCFMNGMYVAGFAIDLLEDEERQDPEHRGFATLGGLHDALTDALEAIQSMVEKGVPLETRLDAKLDK